MSTVKTSSCVINELLCVINNNFGKYSRAELSNICAEYYCESEVETAKSLICEIAESCSPKPEAELKKITVRKGEGKIRRDLEDILNVYTVLDSKKCSLPLIAALDISRIPSFKDFDSNKINTNLNNKIDDLVYKINEKITEMSTSLSSNVSKTLNDLFATSSSQFSNLESSITKNTQEIKDVVLIPLDDIHSSLSNQSLY